uniref:Putative methyltransferase DDB_G0268948 n=1 Tax=Phallusia mammillata TaxID=59560 RepID=A0A6F9DS15_9ASCI|nr:putative methyltransferase DDB_G0268948 [Phallusia mammillata]
MSGLFESKSHTEMYSKCRPKPTAEIVQKVMDFLNKHSPLETSESKHQCMVDVGCGNGQATELFAPYFTEVNGFYVSPNQIEHASRKFSNVKYQVANGESMPLKDKSVDLLISCQAVHWLDLNLFFAECNRVLKPNGCLALIGYIEEKINPVQSMQFDTNAVQKYLMDFVASCKMHPLTSLVDKHYCSVYELIKSKNKIHHDDMQEICNWDLESFRNILSTWSGYQTVIKETTDALIAKHGSKNVTADMIKKQDIIETFINQTKQALNAVDKPDDQVKIKVIREWFFILSDKPSSPIKSETT